MYHVHMKRMYILALLGVVFYKYQLGLLGWYYSLDPRCLNWLCLDNSLSIRKEQCKNLLLRCLFLSIFVDSCFMDRSFPLRTFVFTIFFWQTDYIIIVKVCFFTFNNTLSLKISFSWYQYSYCGLLMLTVCMIYLLNLFFLHFCIRFKVCML